MKKIISGIFAISALFISQYIVHADNLIRPAIESGQVGSPSEYFEFVEDNINHLTWEEILATSGDFLALAPTISELNEYTRNYGYTTDVSLYMQFKVHGFEKRTPQNVREFFELIDYALPPVGEQPSPEYEEALTGLVQKHINLFMELHPGSENIERLIGSFPRLKEEIVRRTVENIRLVIKNGCITTAGEYLRFLQEHKAVLSRDAILSTVDDFLELSPTIDEITQFTKQHGYTTDVSLYMKLKEFGFLRLHSVDDFIQLMDYALPPVGEKPSPEYEKELFELGRGNLERLKALQPTTDNLRQLMKVQPGLTEILFEGFPQLSLEENQKKLHEIRERAHIEVAPPRTRIAKYGGKKRNYLQDLVRRNETFYKSEIDLIIGKISTTLPNLGVKEQQQAIEKAQELIDDRIREALNQTHTAIEFSNGLVPTSWPIPTIVAEEAQMDDVKTTSSTSSLMSSSSSSSTSSLLGNSSVSSPSILMHSAPNTGNFLESRSAVPENCSVCEGEMDDNKVTTHCGHIICKGCFKSHVEMIRKNNEFHCFQQECTERLNASDIQHAELPEEGAAKYKLDVFEKELTEDDFPRWKRNQLLRIPNTIPCPRHDCGRVLRLPEEKKQNFLCSHCHIEICAKCKKQAHKGMLCMVANKKRGDFIPINDDEELQKLIKKKAVQLCPFCKTPGTKVSGCSYIVCPNSKCGKAWTWQGNIIENLLGATHH